MMNRIAFVLFPMVATTLMGIAVVAVLTMDIWATGKPILWAALAGFILSIPVSWLIGRQITTLTAARSNRASG
jgi:predicted PurR-regulated permease PerM